MYKRISKRRTVIASVVSLLLCVTMLLGTTLAWFTDTVTNNGSGIETGGMKVKLLRYNGQEYEDISDGVAGIFQTTGEADEHLNGIQWEPGKTEIVYLQVHNADDLAFNYNIILDIQNDAKNGAQMEKVLNYAILPGDYTATEITSWDNIKTLVDENGGTTGKVPAGKTTAASNGALEGGESDYFALAVHMDESAGNEYQYQAINIDVNVVAKQMSAEADYFGTQYDADTSFREFVIYPPIAGYEELLVDGGMESFNVETDEFTSWGVRQKDNVAIVETEIVQSGTGAVKLTTKDELVSQWIDVVPGATYQLTGYVYLPDGSATGRIKLEQYHTKELNAEFATGTQTVNFARYGELEGFELENHRFATGKWVRFSYIFKNNMDTKYVMLYLRGQSNNSVIYYDDISCSMIEMPNEVALTLNSNSYYTSEQTGIAYLDTNEAFYQNPNWTVKYSVLKGEEVISSGEVNLSQDMEIEFDLTGCTDKNSDYVFKVDVYENSELIHSCQHTFHRRFDRPVALQTDGRYMVTKDDGTQEVFHPVNAYHMSKDADIVRCHEEFGINLFNIPHGWVVQYQTEWDTLAAKFELLRSLGCKATVCLYYKNDICNSPANKELATNYMKFLLDSEYADVIYAWAYEDEPVGKNTDGTIRDAYEMIREIDPIRPVYTIDQREPEYPTLVRNADLICIDNYPYGGYNAMEYIYNSAKYAVGLTEHSGKSLTTLLQAWPYGVGTEYKAEGDVKYCPDGHALRNMIYQTFMAGAEGYGFFGFEYADINDPDYDEAANTPNMRDTEMAEGLKEFAQKEQDMMFDYFVDDEYVTFNSDYENDPAMRYVSFLKDGKIYMVILNRKEYESQTVSVPLTSNNCQVTIADGCTAEAYAGIADYQAVSDGNTTFADYTDTVTVADSKLTVTLKPGAAAVYVIIPSETINASALQ